MVEVEVVEVMVVSVLIGWKEQLSDFQYGILHCSASEYGLLTNIHYNNKVGVLPSYNIQGHIRKGTNL